MKPEFYADQVRRYGTYCRDYGNNKLYKIACGPSDNDYNWTEVIMKNADSLYVGFVTYTTMLLTIRRLRLDFDERAGLM